MEDALGNLTQTDRIYKDTKSFIQGDVDVAKNVTAEFKVSLNQLNKTHKAYNSNGINF